MLRSLLEGRLFAEVYGDSPSVVGLHGWARTRADLTAVVEPFGGWSIDLPGHGASPDPPEAWGAEQYAALVAEALRDARSGRPSVLVGHSMGGRVAVCVAASHPELVAGLVLSGAPLLRRRDGGGAAPPGYRLAKWLHRVGVLSDERMEQQRRKHGSADYRNARGVMRDTLVKLVNEDYRSQLTRITCPVELVWGADDTAAPLWVAEEAATLLADAQLEVLDGVAHDTPALAPAALRSAVERLVARVG